MTTEKDAIGFDIGWDMFVHGIPIPPESGMAVRSGYAEAQSRAHRKAADRYTRKWIRMRFNAHLRSRVVDENVTPEYLMRIDVPICPVTNTLLTHGSGKDSDWSIDRLNNHGGYCVGNLAVMSTRANKAKGAKTLEDIILLAYSEEVMDTGELNRYEWARMAVLMYGASIAENQTFIIPLVVQPAPDTPSTFSQLLQYMLILKNGQRILKRSTTGKARDILLKLCAAVERRSKKLPIGSSMLDIWFNKTLFENFVGFYDLIIDNDEIYANILESQDMADMVGDAAAVSCTWSLESRGYLEKMRQR